MISDRRRQVAEILRAAKERDPQHLSAFLDEACGGNVALRREVESLLETDAEESIQKEMGAAGEGSQQSTEAHRGDEPSFRKVLHYSIVRKLGEGGMGEVYLAEDTKLRRQVALKVLPETLTRNEERKQRFLQEARAAAAIEHPNIAAVHEIGETEGRTFIVMEYVRGETLREAIRGGKLGVSRSIELATQIAEALSKAHERGVVHRDLKPDNILVSRDGYAKIIDFGLAKLAGQLSLDEEDALSDLQTATHFKTRAGTILGTVAYMSPEQARGEPVDPRSDIFAFGAVLHEMLTGQAVFKRPSATETLSAVLRDPPPPLTAEVGRSPFLQEILDKALAKDPGSRYRSFHDLLIDLRQFRERRERSRLRRPMLLAAAVLILLLILGTWFLAQRVGPAIPAAAPDRISVLIADFGNGTGDPVFDGVLEQAVAIGIEGASFINSYQRGQARSEAQAIRPGSDVLDEETARLVAQRQGIDVVLAGNIEGSVGDYRLSIEAIDAPSGESLAAETADVDRKEEVLAAVGELVVRTRRALGDIVAGPEHEATEETFTAASLEAAGAYAEAQELMAVGSCQEAIPLYERAVELDPDFGRAYAGLAACFHNLGRVAEAREQYEAAMARIDRMTEREKRRTRGGYYLMVRNYEKAAEEYQALNDQFPYDAAGLSNLPLAYFYSREMDRTLQAARRMVEIYPSVVLSRANLALFAMYAGDFGTALEQSRTVLESNPGYETAYVALSMAQIAESDLDSAVETYGRLEKVSPFGESLAITGLADLALYSGREGEARELLTRGIASDETSSYDTEAARKRLWLAEIAVRNGSFEQAVALTEQALAAGDREHLLYLAATVLIDARRESRALALAEELGSRFQPEPRTFSHLIQGQVFLARGELQESTAAFREGQRILDTWLGRFHLGRAWLEAGAFTEAYSELEAALERRGEATAVFLDDVPSYHVFPPVHYYLGRAQEGLGSPAAAQSYQTFLAIKENGDGNDPLVADARRRLEGAR